MYVQNPVFLVMNTKLRRSNISDWIGVFILLLSCNGKSYGQKNTTPAWWNVDLMASYLRAFPSLKNLTSKELGLPEGIDFLNPIYNKTGTILPADALDFAQTTIPETSISTTTSFPSEMMDITTTQPLQSQRTSAFIPSTSEFQITSRLPFLCYECLDDDGSGSCETQLCSEERCIFGYFYDLRDENNDTSISSIRKCDAGSLLVPEIAGQTTSEVVELNFTCTDTSNTKLEINNKLWNFHISDSGLTVQFICCDISGCNNHSLDSTKNSTYPLNPLPMDPTTSTTQYRDNTKATFNNTLINSTPETSIIDSNTSMLVKLWGTTSFTDTSEMEYVSAESSGQGAIYVEKVTPGTYETSRFPNVGGGTGVSSVNLGDNYPTTIFTRTTSPVEFASGSGSGEKSGSGDAHLDEASGLASTTLSKVSSSGQILTTARLPGWTLYRLITTPLFTVPHNGEHKTTSLKSTATEMDKTTAKTYFTFSSRHEGRLITQRKHSEQASARPLLALTKSQNSEFTTSVSAFTSAGMETRQTFEAQFSTKTTTNEMKSWNMYLSEETIPEQHKLKLLLLIEETEDIANETFIQTMEAKLANAFRKSIQQNRANEKLSMLSRKLLSMKDRTDIEVKITMVQRMTNKAVYVEFALKQEDEFAMSNRVVEIMSSLSLDELGSILGVPVLSPIMATHVKTSSSPWMVASLVVTPVLLLSLGLLCCVKVNNKGVKKYTVKQIKCHESKVERYPIYLSEDRAKRVAESTVSISEERPPMKSAENISCSPQVRTKIETNAPGLPPLREESASQSFVSDYEEIKEDIAEDVKEPLPNAISDQPASVHEGNYVNMQTPCELPRTAHTAMLDEISNIKAKSDSSSRFPRVNAKTTALVSQPAFRKWITEENEPDTIDVVAQIDADLQRLRTRMNRVQEAERKRNKRRLRQLSMRKRIPSPTAVGVHNPLGLSNSIDNQRVPMKCKQQLLYGEANAGATEDHENQAQNKRKSKRRKLLMTILKDWENRHLRNDKSDVKPMSAECKLTLEAKTCRWHQPRRSVTTDNPQDHDQSSVEGRRMQNSPVNEEIRIIRIVQVPPSRKFENASPEQNVIVKE